MLRSPVRLSAVIVVCGLVAWAGFLGASMHRVHNSLALLLACFVIEAACVAGMFWAGNELRNQVENQRWPEEQIAPFMAAVRHPAWILMMLVSMILMLVALRSHSHHNEYFFAVFFFLQVQTQLGSAFRRTSKKSGPRVPIDWTRVARLNSEHWGER